MGDIHLYVAGLFTRLFGQFTTSNYPRKGSKLAITLAVCLSPTVRIMRKYIVLIIFFGFLAVDVHSQGRVRGSVKGIVADTAGRQPMSEATVSVTPEKDTSDIQFAITDQHGAFLFRNLTPGAYSLLITFENYRHVRRRFTIDAITKDIDLQTVYLHREADLLAEVVIQRPPMQIKKDTIEYNAQSFTTKPNAVAEDQLKKLPGVQVDASGNITAQGEKVTRLLVNGKRFFGNDPKLATRNIPPEIIEKYQIFDDLDDQSKFSGFDDGNRIKTINIVTRRDRRQGYFGRAIAGAGTDEKYDESFNFHRFNNDQQISVLGQGNDINKQNFTVQDVLGSSGSRRGSGGGPNAATNQTAAGITTVWAGGVNYRDSWGKFDAYGSYFYNFNHVSTNTQSLTEKFFSTNQDTSNTTTSSNPAISRTTNQRVNFNIENKSDSGNSFVFRPNITFQTTTPSASSNSSTVDQDGRPVNSAVGNSYSTNNGFNINGSNLTLRHKFRKNFQTLSLDITGTVNVNNGDGYYNSLNTFYKLDSVQNLRQYYNDSLHSVNLSPTLSYTQPISKNSIIEINYNHTYNKSTTINNTYDFVDPAKGYAQFDSLFSNSYKFVSNSDRFTLNYRLQAHKANINIGSGIPVHQFQQPEYQGYRRITKLRKSHSNDKLYLFLFEQTAIPRILYGSHGNAQRKPASAPHHHHQRHQLYGRQPLSETAVHTCDPAAVFVLQPFDAKCHLRHRQRQHHRQRYPKRHRSQ